MAELTLYGNKVESIFELLGQKENDITFSIGWALANGHFFFREFLGEALPKAICYEDAAIQLQEFRPDSGITDIEIRGRHFHIIVEAKRGWILPGRDQLNLYANRLGADNDQQNLIVVMSECSQEYASIHLPKTTLNVPIKYFSWKNIALLTETVKNASHAEKRLLEQLRLYLKRIVNMQNQLSNMVFVVSLKSGIIEKCSISWIDVVDKKHRYFYPVEKGWPSDPPNYLGFRYNGRLQRIHHVEAWKIVDDLHTEIEEIGAGLWDCRYNIFELGPPIVPTKTVKSGNIYGPGHGWAMLDLLLTCDTVSEACGKTKERQGLR